MHCPKCDGFATCVGKVEADGDQYLEDERIYECDECDYVWSE